MEVKYTDMTFNLIDILDAKTFSVPNFQRGITWSKSKKEGFVKTLIAGNPFGTILVYRDKKNNNVLIDGLQRITTIREFYANPYQFVKKEILDEKKVNALVREIKKLCRTKEIMTPDLDKRLTFDKARARIFKDLQDHNDYVEIKADLLSYFKIDLYPKDTISIEKNIKEIVDDVENKLDINNLRVYAIAYNGEEDKLPDIFYNLNTGGLKPSTYEVLASLWDKKTYKIKDKILINKVYARYETLKKDSKLKISMTKETLQKDGISLFEYCYAIGSIITDKNRDYYHFLGNIKNGTEPIGFDILSLLVGQKVNEASKLDKKLGNATPKFLVDLKNVIIDGFDHIYSALEKWIFTEQGNVVPVRSNYMIFHMFMAYVKMNYNIDCVDYKITKKDSANIRKWNKLFAENLHLHYFYDYVSGYWTFHRQVTNLMDDINDEKILYKYSTEITTEKWTNMLEVFKEQQKNEGGTVITNKAKLFIDYLIKFKIMAEPNLRKKYFKSKIDGEQVAIDIEHIVSKERIDYLFEIFNQSISGFPVSYFGNLCYLTAKVNRSKGKYTIYEDQSDRPGYIIDKDFISFVNYPTEENLEFLKNPTFDAFYKDYMEFVDARACELIAEFIELRK